MSGRLVSRATAEEEEGVDAVGVAGVVFVFVDDDDVDAAAGVAGVAGRQLRGASRRRPVAGRPAAANQSAAQATRPRHHRRPRPLPVNPARCLPFFLFCVHLSRFPSHPIVDDLSRFLFSFASIWKGPSSP